MQESEPGFILPLVTIASNNAQNDNQEEQWAQDSKPQGFVVDNIEGVIVSGRVSGVGSCEDVVVDLGVYWCVHS